MNISQINNVSFKGLLTISGTNKNNDIIVNSKAVSTINASPYIGAKEGNVLGLGNNEGAVLTMNSGTRIRTFVPLEAVVEAYRQAEVNGEAKLETKYNPIMSRPLID